MSNWLKYEIQNYLSLSKFIIPHYSNILTNIIFISLLKQLRPLNIYEIFAVVVVFKLWIPLKNIYFLNYLLDLWRHWNTFLQWNAYAYTFNIHLKFYQRMKRHILWMVKYFLRTDYKLLNTYGYWMDDWLIILKITKNCE